MGLLCYEQLGIAQYSVGLLLCYEQICIAQYTVGLLCCGMVTRGGAVKNWYSPKNVGPRWV